MSLTVLPGFIEESKVWTVWSSCLMCTLLCCVGIAHCLLCQWYLLHPCKDLGFSFFKSVILAGRWPALVFSNTVILMFENAATSGASQMISLLEGPMYNPQIFKLGWLGRLLRSRMIFWYVYSWIDAHEISQPSVYLRVHMRHDVDISSNITSAIVLDFRRFWNRISCSPCSKF